MQHDQDELRGAMGLQRGLVLKSIDELNAEQNAEERKDSHKNKKQTELDGGEVPWDTSPAAKEAWTCQVPKDLCHAAAMKLLCAARDVFSKHGISWWLIHGTLLGAHREGGIIEGDNDIDYGLWEEDYVELVQKGSNYEPLLKDLREKGLHIPIYGQVHWIEAPHGCPKPLHLDNWVYRVVDGKRPGTKGAYVQYVPCVGKNLAQRYARSHFVKLSTTKMGGNLLPAPSNTEKLIEQIYGPQWRFPMANKGNDGESCN